MGSCSPDLGRDDHGGDHVRTIARITQPTDAPAKGTLRDGFLGRDSVGSSMSRADIAAFLVDQLTSTL